MIDYGIVPDDTLSLLHMRRQFAVRPIWKVLFALLAILDIQFIITLLKHVGEKSAGECRSNYADDDFSINYTFWDRVSESTFTISNYVWIGPAFCLLCIVEALVRAVEARRAALNNRAFDELETSLLRAAKRHQSSTKLSMFFLGSADDDSNESGALATSLKVLRLWVPAIIIISFWLFILPINMTDFHIQCGSDRLHDSSVATQWINQMMSTFSDFQRTFQGLLESFFWTRILPYKIHKEPHRFFNRLQVILRWIRFLRFAGPLFRMVLKLQDQLQLFLRLKRQSASRDKEKQKRIDRPSLLFADIQKLLQLAKVQTTFAQVPSISVLTHPRLNKISSQVMDQYHHRREFGKKVSSQLKKLQADYFSFGNKSFTATSDMYDRILSLKRDLRISSNSVESMNYSNRYLREIKSFLSSREYLISPRTRFSLTWRMTVTNCLLLEIARLVASWHLSKTFSVPLSQVVGRLFVQCKEPEQMKHVLDFIIDPINRFRRQVFSVLHLFDTPAVDVAVCIPIGLHSVTILLIGRMLEVFVDAVAYFDIFVWFLTGEIDETHAIIPKPFISRCIIPGTLVQVLDHPTLPDLLPSLMRSILATSALIGYSRCIRWILAVIPALKMLVLDPMSDYLFHHLEEDDGLMRYAESVGMITPRNSESLATTIGDSQRQFLHKNSDGFNTSTVNLGLNFDASPFASRNDLNMIPSQTDESTMSIEVSHVVPTYSGMAMENSPVKRNKTVQFFNEELTSR